LWHKLSHCPKPRSNLLVSLASGVLIAESHGGGRVPSPGHEFADRRARLGGQGEPGVTQPVDVRPGLPIAARATTWASRRLDADMGERPPIGRREQQVVGAARRVRPQPRAEARQQRRRDRHDAETRGGLRPGDHVPGAPLDRLLLHVDHASFEVEIPAPEPPHLPTAPSAPPGQHERHPVVLRRRLEVGDQLGRGQSLGLLRASLLAATLHLARVVLDDLVLDGVLQDGLQQPVRVGLLGGRRRPTWLCVTNMSPLNATPNSLPACQHSQPVEVDGLQLNLDPPTEAQKPWPDSFSWLSAKRRPSPRIVVRWSSRTNVVGPLSRPPGHQPVAAG